MNDSGYIRIYRQIRSWEWYKSPNTLVLFLHLLLTANYTDGRFEGEVIKRGELVTSTPSLAAGTGLTIKEVRTALDHLLRTGEVADRKIRRGRVITISKYDEFQGGADDFAVYGQLNGRQRADEGQTNGRQRADEGQQYNNNNKAIIEEEQEEQKIERVTPPPRRFTPPSRDEVSDYCFEMGIQIDVDRFCDYYDAVGWKIGGKTQMKDWRAAVRNWARRDATPVQAPASVPVQRPPQKKVTAQAYEQRDYSQEDIDARERMLRMMREAGI